MILGRPSNLWLGALTALFNVAVLIAGMNGVTFQEGFIAAVNIMFGAVILLIAGQPPTIGTNDTVTVKTTNGSPDKRISFDNQGVATTVPITERKNDK